VDVRTAVGDSLQRLRAGGWSAVQCGLGAAGAWAFATQVLGHPRPFFAPVAAVVALGVGGGGRLRRTAELAFGVALGVGVGDLLVLYLGQGAWQIGVVVTIALLLAVAAGGGNLAVTQSGLQAVFVVALPRTPHSGIHRWQDALVGGGAALLVAAAAPNDPWRNARRLADRYVHSLADVLRATAAGIRSSSVPMLRSALERGRALEPHLVRWEAALAAGHETARLSPLYRRTREEGQAARRLTVGLTRSSRNLRVLVRRVLASVQAGTPLPPTVPDLLEELADVVDQLPSGDAALDSLVDLAMRLDPVALGASNLAGQVVVGQLRVAVLDLLEALGLDPERARMALPELPS
jgi:uncharacterized membrane protein YgaE (UPF0421/DUF939 family)